MEVGTLRDTFNQVVKKQRLSHSKSQELIAEVEHVIEQALVDVQSDHDHTVSFDQKPLFKNLKNNLSVSLNQMEVVQKDLKVNLNEYKKVIEKTFHPDLAKAYKNIDLDQYVINQIIVAQLYHEGQFEIGDSLMSESGESEEVASLRLHFLEMHHILEAMKSHDLKPALKWISANNERLSKLGSKLELKIHELLFVDVLKKGNKKEAIIYAKTNLAPLAAHHMEGIQKLMGCLLWIGQLDQSPYTEIMCPTNWAELIQDVTQEFCSMLGHSGRSPLYVALSAGIEGLPTLLKLANVMAAKQNEWQEMMHWPVPIVA
ncbi:hypothetical protein Leryth_004099 [Lithospermum erythrorhizon]|nr:hypothetical protein Leryth_004099 [Lithospermum erythrorhizon]